MNICKLILYVNICVYRHKIPIPATAINVRLQKSPICITNYFTDILSQKDEMSLTTK